VTDRPLSVAEVLNDEVDYLVEDAPKPQWRFVAGDIYDVLTLVEKVRARRPVRYRLLEIVSNADPSDAERVAASELNALLASQTLLGDLLADPEFGGLTEDAIVWNDTKLLGGILTNPATRRVFIEQSPDRLEFLLNHLDFLINAIDEGELVRRLLTGARTSQVRMAVEKQPRLLGPIITSRAVRVYLDRCRACRRNFLNAADRDEMFAAANDVALNTLVLRRITDQPIDEAVDDGRMELKRINALLIEAAFRDHINDHIDEKVAFERLRSADLTAVCFSGGGIRSATFNLGVLQALAKCGVLSDVHYLSTVSGGGYIGSWLSSWMRRHEHGPEGVIDELRQPPNDPLEPEPKPVVHLREYSNYLAPRAGPLTVDMWTLFGTYLRNLALIWTVLLPPLMLLLAVPRLFEQVILIPGEGTRWFVAGAYLLLVSTIAIAALRPVRDGFSRPTKWHFTLFLLPGFFAAVCFAVALAHHWRAHPQPRIDDVLAWHIAKAAFLLLGAINFIACIVYMARYARARRRSDDAAYRSAKYPAELFAPLVAAVCGAGAVYLVIRWILNNPTATQVAPALDAPEQYAIFAVPLFIFALFVEAAAFVGVTTRVSADWDREWWARAAAMMTLASAVWMVVATIAITGPALILQSPKIIGALGGLSAVGAALAGYSRKTPAKEHRKSARTALIAVAAVAIIAILSALSLLITALLPKAEPPPERPPSEQAGLLIHASVSAPPGYALHVEQKPKEISKFAKATEPAKETKKHIATLRDPNGFRSLLYIFAGILGVILLATMLDANDYSMHSMYRNRLIRAYLGASRWNRMPDRFTGFDPEDNLQMWQLRPDLLWLGSFKDFRAFAAQLQMHPIATLLPRRVRSLVITVQKADDRRLAQQSPAIIAALNDLILLYDLETRLPARRTGRRVRKNRAYLDREFSSFIEHQDVRERPPLHILNIALNLVSGDNLAWQQRKAESFTVSMLHTGSEATNRLKYRDSASYGGRKGISLGTAMAISGAAVSPNQGYYSSSVVTFLMTLFNARLGWWLGNPGPGGRKTWTSRGPWPALVPLINEAFGQTNDRSAYVFLSDGGHFENLGLYEMVRRRCRRIIVCDAAADPNYDFSELGNAIRKIRVDFGIPVEFETFCIGPDPADPTKKREAAYCALGTIRYAAVDSPRDGNVIEDGHLLYVKPVVYSDCPEDVKNYERVGKPFPQESTADQFFDETQFESYRMLGLHIASKIAGNATDADSFFQAAHRYLTRHRHEHRC